MWQSDEEALAGSWSPGRSMRPSFGLRFPDRNHVPFDFVWSLTGPRSRKARREVMGEYGGIPLELVKVDLGEDVEVTTDSRSTRKPG